MTLAPTRRSFMSTLAGGFVAVGGARTLDELSTALAAPASDEDYWRMVRQQFAFTEQHVPLNAANLCPAPRVVAERVIEWTSDIERDCSFNNRSKFRPLHEEARSKIAAHLGVTADEIALVRNTSEANNTVNGGLPLKSGDEVRTGTGARLYIRLAEGSVVKLGEKVNELQQLKLASFAAQLQGFSTGKDFVSAVMNQLGVDLRSRESLENAGLRPEGGVVLAVLAVNVLSALVPGMDSLLSGAPVLVVVLLVGTLAVLAWSVARGRRA